MNLRFQTSDLAGPVAQAMLLLALGLVCLYWRRYRSAAALGVLATSWMILCATPAFAELLRHGLVNSYATHPPAEYPPADAIVVLGGGDPPSFGHGPGSEQTNRTGFALDLYRSGKAPVILMSGGTGEAAEMVDHLQRQGVPAAALRAEPDSTTTYQNAVYSARILEHEHRHRILLVTSIIPMRRAVISFEQQGLEVIPAPIFDANGAPVPGARWRPQITALSQSERYLHEYVGMLVYKVRDWL